MIRFAIYQLGTRLKKSRKESKKKKENQLNPLEIVRVLLILKEGKGTIR